MYKHRIVLDTLAAFDLGSLASKQSHRNEMPLPQSREHRLEEEVLLQVENSKEFNPEPQQSESSSGHSWGIVSL